MRTLSIFLGAAANTILEERNGVGYASTFVGPKRCELIDLRTCITKLLELFRYWQFLDEDPLSDHNYLEFSATIAGKQSVI